LFVVRALDLVGVPHVAVVSHDASAQQEVAHEGIQNFLDVRPGTGGVGPLHVDAELVAEYSLPCVLVGTKGVPLLGNPLLLDVEVTAVDCHQTIITNIVDETALKNNLWFCARQLTMQ
jgi:hypothetical protein